MPRIKKSTVIDKAEVQPTLPEEGEDNNAEKATTDISVDIQETLPKITKKEFKQLYMKETFWLENDIYQTIEDLTEGKKGPKALIINEALKDYLKNNNLAIQPLRVKAKKD